MNSFMRSIGFKGYGLQDEDALIRRAISAGIKADKVFYNDRHGRAMIVYGVSPSAGVGIFGHMTGDKFIYDTHFPYLFTNRATKEKEIVIFKSLTSEYFSGITENVKGDIPRVFFVSNPVDVLFDIDVSVAKRRCSFGFRLIEPGDELFVVSGDAHSAPSAAGCRFDENRISELSGDFERFVFVFD